MLHLTPPRHIEPIYFYRYSPYFYQQKQLGLNLKPHPLYSLIYPFPQKELETLALEFENAAADPQQRERLGYWLHRIGHLVRTWQARWTGRDGGPRPGLSIEVNHDSAVIGDTRYGGRVEHTLRPLAVEVLRALERPRTISELSRTGLATSEAQIAQQVADLDGLDLLFEEDGRYMSLVIWPSDPADPPSARQQPAMAVDQS